MIVIDPPPPRIPPPGARLERTVCYANDPIRERKFSMPGARLLVANTLAASHRRAAPILPVVLLTRSPIFLHDLSA